MPVIIRLARFGKRNHPVYRITVADHRRIPTGRFLEQIGTFNPRVNLDRVKDLRLNTMRAKYWLSVGAQTSPAVARLFGMFNLLPPHPQHNATLAHFPDPILRFGPKPKPEAADLSNPPDAADLSTNPADAADLSINPAPNASEAKMA